MTFIAIASTDLSEMHAMGCISDTCATDSNNAVRLTSKKSGKWELVGASIDCPQIYIIHIIILAKLKKHAIKKYGVHTHTLVNLWTMVNPRFTPSTWSKDFKATDSTETLPSLQNHWCQTYNSNLKKKKSPIFDIWQWQGISLVYIGRWFIWALHSCIH